MLKINRTENLENIVERMLTEDWHDKGNASTNDTVIFFNGEWHNEHGSVISLSDEEEAEIVHDIVRIERNYDGIIWMGMQNARGIEDIADYADVELNDLFLFYHGTNPSKYDNINPNNAKLSPSSQIRGINDSLYMIGGMQSEHIGAFGFSYDVKYAEIADMCGHVSITAGRSMLEWFLKWCVSRNALGFGASCRESTSNRLLNNRRIGEIISSYGYENIKNFDETLDFGSEVFDDEDFIINVFVNASKWRKIPNKIKQVTIRKVMDYLS